MLTHSIRDGTIHGETRVVHIQGTKRNGNFHTQQLDIVTCCIIFRVAFNQLNPYGERHSNLPAKCRTHRATGGESRLPEPIEMNGLKPIVASNLSLVNHKSMVQVRTCLEITTVEEREMQAGDVNACFSAFHLRYLMHGRNRSVIIIFFVIITITIRTVDRAYRIELNRAFPISSQTRILSSPEYFDNMILNSIDVSKNAISWALACVAGVCLPYTPCVIVSHRNR